MRVKPLLFFIVAFSWTPLPAQNQPINFRQLQQFLPQTDYDVYKRAKPTGETSSMMGFSTSWAQVTYIYATDTSVSSISIKITDMINLPSYMSITPSIAGDVDRETETGYEKTVMYDSTKVLESYDSVAHQGKLQLLVAKRFLVEITGTYIPGTKPLYGIFDLANVEGLKKLVQPENSGGK